MLQDGAESKRKKYWSVVGGGGGVGGGGDADMRGEKVIARDRRTRKYCNRKVAITPSQTSPHPITPLMRLTPAASCGLPSR